MVKELVVLYLALLFQNSTELFRETHKLIKCGLSVLQAEILTEYLVWR